MYNCINVYFQEKWFVLAYFWLLPFGADCETHRGAAVFDWEDSGGIMTRDLRNRTGLSQGNEKGIVGGWDREKATFVSYKQCCNLSIPHLCPLFV